MAVETVHNGPDTDMFSGFKAETVDYSEYTINDICELEYSSPHVLSILLAKFTQSSKGVSKALCEWSLHQMSLNLSIMIPEHSSFGPAWTYLYMDNYVTELLEDDPLICLAVLKDASKRYRVFLDILSSKLSANTEDVDDQDPLDMSCGYPPHSEFSLSAPYHPDYSWRQDTPRRAPRAPMDIVNQFTSPHGQQGPPRYTGFDPYNPTGNPYTAEAQSRVFTDAMGGRIQVPYSHMSEVVQVLKSGLTTKAVFERDHAFTMFKSSGLNAHPDSLDILCQLGMLEKRNDLKVGSYQMLG